MKIRTKLLWGSSWILILIAALAGVGWYQVSSMNSANQIMRQNFKKVLISAEIQRIEKNEAIELRNLLLENRQSETQQSVSAVQKDNDALSVQINSLDSIIFSAQERQFVAKLEQTYQQYNDLREKVVALVSQGDRQSAANLLLHDGQALQMQYSQDISDLSSYEQTAANSEIQSNAKVFFYQYLVLILVTFIFLIVGIWVLFRIAWGIASRLNRVSQIMARFANGEDIRNSQIEITTNDEIDIVADAFNHMAQSLQDQSEREKKINQANQEQAWIKSNIAAITTMLSGIEDVHVFAKTLIQNVTPLIEAKHGVFYLTNTGSDGIEFNLLASYAYKERKNVSNRFRLGEGLIGQSALENIPILITDIPDDYIKINSGLGEAPPKNILVVPVSFEGDVKAVIELASFTIFNETQQFFLDELVGNIGILLDSIFSRMKLAELLAESQALTEELQAQSEELQTQQEELRVINEELEAQTHALQKSEEKLQSQQAELERTNIEITEKARLLEEQNQEIELAKTELEHKAQQLELSSRYKSEFLANMSHELRTPLNSLLILSKLMADNKDSNLTEKQVEFMKTIYSSGCDLLILINDVLDLSKIESGKMDIQKSEVRIVDVKNFIQRQFNPVAQSKNLDFAVEIESDAPDLIYSDKQRVQQVLQNLLSNAFKFTDQGRVVFKIGSVNTNGHEAVAFSVVDTGIGIPKDKQLLIFEAFQQADGTTSRKYGGTGLGLSVSREIACLLGGEIVVDSEEGKGSTFTFIIPIYRLSNSTFEIRQLDEVASTREPLVVPITELNTPIRFADTRKFEIGSKKPNPKNYSGAKKVLIVDDDKHQRISLIELIGSKNVIITAVSSAAEALAQLRKDKYDCMILDLGLSDLSGFELLEKINQSGKHSELMIFIYTGRDLSEKEEIQLKKYAKTIIMKDVSSPIRLMEEFEWYMRQFDDADHNQPSWSEGRSNNLEIVLTGKKIMLVDDDVRNVFALTNVLELQGMEIIFAENGRECLQVLNRNADVNLILMDIMMPEMDGYEAIRSIRATPDFSSLPIIALTAKAMKDDRQKCMDAGASDYIMKPVNTDQLLSLIGVWLHSDGGKTNGK